MKKILYAEDQKSYANKLMELLAGDCDFTLTDTCVGVLELLFDNNYDVLLLDKYLTDGSTLRILPELKKMYPNIPIVLLTADTDPSESIHTLFELGASDYITKFLLLDKESESRTKFIADLKCRLNFATPRGSDTHKNRAMAMGQDSINHLLLIGRSHRFQTVKRQLSAIRGMKDVAILGAAGTGRTHLAKIVAEKFQATSNFLHFDCNIESQESMHEKLFSERGVLTKLSFGKPTVLIFDNIDELSESTLDFIDEHFAFQKSDKIKLIITLKNLDQENPFFRKFFKVELPTLKDRIDDVGLLARHFLLISKGFKYLISKDVISFLQERPWIGNVKELSLAVKRAALLASANNRLELLKDDFADSKIIPSADNQIYISLPERKSAINEASIQQLKTLVEREFLKRTFELFNWNIAKAGEKLGLGKTQIYEKKKQYQLGEKS